jgi:hypothetical protein
MSVFISHAQADKALVDAFVDLLQTGLDISRKEVFCTSLEDMGIPTGSDFVAFIKKKLGKAAFVIAIITPRYYESLFCLCELGATWITSKDFFPILVPPLDYADLKAVLSPAQVAKINDVGKLNELYDRLRDAGLGSASAGRWRAKQDAFLRKLPKLLKKLAGPSVVAATKYESLELAYKETQEIIEEKDAEIAELQELVEDLKKLKDAKAVRSTVRKHSSKQQAFDTLVEEVAQSTSRIPHVAVFALYHETIGDPWKPNLGYGREDLADEVEDATQNGYIESDEASGITGSSHPKMNRARSAIEALRAFLDSDEADGLATEFEREHDYPLDIANREFWESHLGL